jgi:tetratricopeptide (TPR) repeat protein
MSLRCYLCALILIVASILAGCAAGNYGAPPETSDPWALIHNARNWLQRGRPRGAMPSLQKALVEVEKFEHDKAIYLHTKASIYNELGRVYEMTSMLDLAEEHFLKAAEIATGVPERRPVLFEIRYNLSTVYERKTQLTKSCNQLRQTVALHRELLAHPADPPEGYGAKADHFLREIAAPQIRARAQRIGCDIDK